MNTSIVQLPDQRIDNLDGQRLSVSQMQLGTVVEISGHGESQAIARCAIDAAFEEVALIHRLMSFHREDSDVSRLNRLGPRRAVTVNARTVEVIRLACEISRLTDGVFDLTVAPELVGAGHLPLPLSACSPSHKATWRDIEIVADDAVVFHKPLWLDLGGIAKGYAVDRAFEACSNFRLNDCIVNAGGDIRISEGTTGSIQLDVPESDAERIGCIELAGGSIASSCGWRNATLIDGQTVGCHFNGVTRSKVDPMRFVSVLAQNCMVADALTKAVLVLADGASPVLSRYGATALIHEKKVGWKQVPAC